MKDKTGLDPKDPKNFGDFIRICVADAIKEEQDTIIENGFEVKEFTKAVPTIVRQWFFSLNV
jgi:predicted DNA-binding ribbon-helix-helix protein